MFTRTIILTIAAMASIATADNVADVTKAIGTLPVCAQTCVAQIPGVTLPVTDAAIAAVCGNLAAVVTAYTTCIGTGCTSADDQKAASGIVVALSPICANLGSMTSAAASATPSATGNSTMMMSSSTAAPSSTAASAKNGATGTGVNSMFVGAGAVVVAVGAIMF
ncbi:hypothetical protein HDU76_004460 [Blyttiomyces sp. JEL0837]|nr:hypothetical protein HDU76_004460 [Blyttiomyces sp. JEL0837]